MTASLILGDILAFVNLTYWIAGMIIKFRLTVAIWNKLQNLKVQRGKTLFKKSYLRKQHTKE